MSKGVGLGRDETAAEPARRPPLALLAGLVAAVALISVVVTKMVLRPPAPRAVALSVVVPPGATLEGGLENNVLAIAPDGQSLAFTAQAGGAQRLFLRRLDRPDAVEMPGTSDARNPG